MVILIWTVFIVFILLMLALDLGVFNRDDHVIGTREALIWTSVWIVLALVFNVAVYYLYKHDVYGIASSAESQLTAAKAAKFFLTGYVIEKSLSLDNIFVIALIFSYFHVPGEYQHRVLFWGIIGALVMRGVMIAAGVALIHHFEWIVYVFGAILLLTAFKMLVSKHEKVEPERNPLVRLARRVYPVTPDYVGHSFFTRMGGKRAITPLFLVLLVVESTDLLFAVDSIPAILAITTDPFLVFTSNVFAILGLRSLYFALASVMRRFRYVRLSLVFVLAFVGVKMLLGARDVHIPVEWSLGVIAAAVLIGILASLLKTRGEREELAVSS